MVSHLYNISFIFLTSPFMVDFIVCIRVIRVIHSTDHPLCSFVIMSFCLQKNHLSPFVIMSFCLQKSLCLRPSLCYSVSKNHLSLSVSMLFCLKKIICLHLSLCHSVFKNPSVFVRLPVILSLIYSVCLMLKCLYKEACKGPEKRRGICIKA
mgnify:CR=1 FL=1